MYPDSEILFPYRAVKGLKHVRGDTWRHLVEHVLSLPENHPDAMAFSFLVLRLADCLHCDQSSYKAFLGCQSCSQRVIAGFKGTDEDLVYLYEEARGDVHRFIETGTPPPPDHLVPVKVRPVDAVEETTAPRRPLPWEEDWDLLDRLVEIDFLADDEIDGTLDEELLEL